MYPETDPRCSVCGRPFRPGDLDWISVHTVTTAARIDYYSAGAAFFCSLSCLAQHSGVTTPPAAIRTLQQRLGALEQAIELHTQELQGLARITNTLTARTEPQALGHALAVALLEATQ